MEDMAISDCRKSPDLIFGLKRRFKAFCIDGARNPHDSQLGGHERLWDDVSTVKVYVGSWFGPSVGSAQTIVVDQVSDLAVEACSNGQDYASLVFTGSSYE